MRFSFFFPSPVCLILLYRSAVTAELFDDLYTEDYDLFSPVDFGDPLAQFEPPLTDPLAYNIAPPTDALAYPEISPPSFSDSNLFADFTNLDCAASDMTQDPLIGKRIDSGSEDRPQMCHPQRSNPGRYPGFDPQNDPLVREMGYGPDDEEFCPRQAFFPSFLVCDSGYFVDRGPNVLTGLFKLNRCVRSMILIASSFCPLCAALISFGWSDLFFSFSETL